MTDLRVQLATTLASLRSDTVLWPASIALLGILAAEAPSPISLLLILVAGALAALMPRHGIVALPATLAWFHQPVAVGAQAFPASELLLLATGLGCGVGWLARLRREQQRRAALDDLRRMLTNPLTLCLLLLTTVGLLLALRPYDPAHRSDALREWRWVLADPLLFVLLLQYQSRLWRRSLTSALLTAFLAGAAAASALALVDLAIGGGVVADGARRIAGPFPHPNALALYIARATVLGAAVVVIDRERQHHNFLLIGMTALCGVATLATLSRGGMLALLIGGLLMLGLLGRRERVWIAGLGAGAAVVLLTVARDRMLDTFGGGSASLRLNIWSSAVDMIRARPIIGYGPDQFLYAYLPRFVQPEAWNERFTAHAHNLVADAWIRLGIIGAFGAALLLLYAARCAWHALKPEQRPQQTRRIDVTMQRAAQMAVVALVAHGLIDNALFAHDLAMSAALLLWVALRTEPTKPSEEIAHARPDRWRRWVHRIAPVRQPAG